MALAQTRHAFPVPLSVSLKEAVSLNKHDHDNAALCARFTSLCILQIAL